jgi:hypothetical protein
MYHKIRSTLTALGLSLGVITASVLFSGPIQAVPNAITPAIALTPEQAEKRLALAILDAAISVAAAGITLQTASANADPREQPASPRPDTAEPVTSRTGLRLQLGMPYYSFGAILPRRRES